MLPFEPSIQPHDLYLRSSQIKREGLETEYIMGHSCARRTVSNVVNMMSQTHYQSFKDFIDDAIKKQVAVSPHNR